ncbi:MAG TPA: carbohydrate ABC transporter permease, partial [Aggregatilineales bacterium]|nr:carbohydrate ABC transporter permease [Aggregatilineales bacterium]
DGTTRIMAGLKLIRGAQAKNEFIDPSNTEEIFIWEGNWRELKQIETLEIHLWENIITVWESKQANFPVMIRNTIAIAALGMIGTLLSCISVAYAFARFPIPRKRMLFLILVSTIVLPSQVTLVPTFGFFATIGWTGTWLPLIVPHFFANAYNVFLLRQYFLTLPKELDEAAMIDGAGPFRILLSVIIPQSYPVIVAVAIFHLVFAWNDYFMPLIYLLGKEELQPMAVGIQRFNYIFDVKPHLLQSSMLLGLIIPVLIFLFAQRFFMRGVVITGVEK